MKFSGKSAIVTGAAKGIGFAVSKHLASEGANVLLVDVDAEVLDEARNALSNYPGKIESFLCDVSDEERVKTTCKFAIQEFGKVDILVNNAAIFRADLGLFENSDSSAWTKKININILGTLYFTRGIIGNMLDKGYGRIINISSVAAVYGLANMVDYSMTKGAVLSFTQALAKEVTERGVLVNAVSPGGFLGADIIKGNDLSFINRVGTYDECANLICFLASDDASYISGQNYIIDGCRKKM